MVLSWKQLDRKGSVQGNVPESFKGLSLLRERLPLALRSVTGNSLHAFSHRKLISSASSVSTGYRGPCIGKIGLLSQGKEKNPPGDSCIIIRDFSGFQMSPIEKREPHAVNLIRSSYLRSPNTKPVFKGVFL